MKLSKMILILSLMSLGCATGAVHSINELTRATHQIKGWSLRTETQPREESGRSESVFRPATKLVFNEQGNRWIVFLHEVPIAEVAIGGRATRFEVGVVIEEGGAMVTLHHFGDASLAPSQAARASLGLPVSLLEVDLHEPGPASPALETPPPLSAEDKKLVLLAIVPPSALGWPIGGPDE